MAKFAYRMQSILDIKEKMEGQAKIAYGVANAKLKSCYKNHSRNVVN